jgi:hypothetical protein
MKLGARRTMAQMSKDGDLLGGMYLNCRAVNADKAWSQSYDF